MCGIAGGFPAFNLSLGAVSKMIENLAHRGPDDSGVWSDPQGMVQLGHCRLSIVDLSSGGHQPMTSHCGRYTITYNGEIYNYVELRQDLEKLGVKFHGHSDTEVLLEAFSAWGIAESLGRTIGMFAFALWDASAQQVILARDRAGKKPLYYYDDRRVLCFASELNAIRCCHGLDFSLDPASIWQYLTFGYVPSPRTIFKNVHSVPAGQIMKVDAVLAHTCEPYWRLESRDCSPVSFNDALEQTEALLCDAVRIRMRADVPVGCFLSGGIDSGLLTAIASRYVASPLKTFTVAPDNSQFDESSLAALVSTKYSTDHHVLRISSSVETILPEVIRAYGQPFADASAIPSFCVSRAAAKSLKVVLNGEGADELFGGYRRHIAVRLMSQLRKFYQFIPSTLLLRLYSLLPVPTRFRSGYAFLHRFLRGGISADPYERYIAWCVDGFTEGEKKEHCLGEFAHSMYPAPELFATYDDNHELDSTMFLDFHLNMHDDMLVKMDIATMAHSLEGRNPFLDHRLIEWAFRIPGAVKLRSYRTKAVLRALAAKYLPEQLVNAPKRGFELPLVDLLRHEISGQVREMCLRRNGIILQLFDSRYIEALLSGKLELDPARWATRVWNLFVLAMWEVV